MKSPKGIILMCLALLLSSVALAACGSSSSDSSSNETSSDTTTAAETNEGETTETEEGEAAGSSSAGFEKAAAEAAKYEEERTGEPVPKLAKPAPADASITIATCAIPACKQTTDGAAAAAKELGWSVDYKTFQLNPESYQSVLKEVAQDPPEIFFFISTFPTETVESQLEELKEAGTAIVQSSPQAGEEPSELTPSILQGPPFFIQGGEVGAYKILADAGEPTDVAVITDPAFGFATATEEGFKKVFTELCPECGVDEIEVGLTLPAPQQLSLVTNYLQQHPETKYLFYSLSDQAAGLPEALASGGYSDVQFVTQTASLNDLKQVAEGKELATIQNENFSAGYRGVDAGLRLMLEGNPGPQKFPAGYNRILTEENVVPGKLPVTPGTPEDYLKAWGVGG